MTTTPTAEDYTLKTHNTMNWKTYLDRYITTQPTSDFDDWCEQVTEAFIDEFYEQNEDWIQERNGKCTEWLNKLIQKSPSEAAAIIERAHKLYRL